MLMAQIQPRHYILSRNYGDIQIEKYWDAQYPDKFTKEVRTEEEMIEGVCQRLLDAVRVRLRADVPVGIYLSGGIDSSAIAGMVVHLVKEGAKLGDSSSQDLSRIQCFTVQFDKDSGVDESDIAQHTADFLGIKYNTIQVTEEILANRLEEVVWNSESFLADINGSGKLAMAEVAHSAGFKVVITGEGSDEHFGGYPWFENELLLEEDQTWQNADYSKEKHDLAIQDVGRNQLKGVKWVVPETLPLTTKILNNTRVAGFLVASVPLMFADWTNDPNKLTKKDHQTVYVDSLTPETQQNMRDNWHPLHTAEYTWTKTCFTNSLLRYLGDNIDMAYQVESRPAFLEYALTDYANSIPPSLKMRYNYDEGTFTEKCILRDAVKPFVTEEINKRKKQAYLGPLKYAIDGPVHCKLKELVTKENVEELGFVDRERTGGLVGRAIEAADPLAFRAAITVAQFVVVSKRFKVGKAVPGEQL
ncbi:hypothetical protein BJX70DRAFT_54866 [Aspergillus crustosus]